MRPGQELLNHLSSAHLARQLFARHPLKVGEACPVCLGEGRDTPYTMTSMRANYLKHLGVVHGLAVELLPPSSPTSSPCRGGGGATSSPPSTSLRRQQVSSP